MDSNRIKIDFNKFDLTVDFEFKYYKEYLEFNRSKLEERRVSLEAMLREDILDNPGSKTVLEEIYADDKIKFPSYFYHSTIVSLYSILEVCLNDICELIIKETGFHFTLDEITGRDYILKSRLFLERVCGVNFKKVDQEWQSIKEYQKIRNFIVHDNSRCNLKKVDAGLKRKLRNSGYLIENGEYLTFYINKSDIVELFLKTIEQFLKKLITQLHETEFSLIKKPVKLKKYHSLDLDLELDDLPF